MRNLSEKTADREREREHDGKLLFLLLIFVCALSVSDLGASSNSSLDLRANKTKESLALQHILNVNDKCVRHECFTQSNKDFVLLEGPTLTVLLQ